MKLSAEPSERKHGRDRAAVALVNDDDTLALAVLVLGETTVARFSLVVGGLDVAAEISAVDFDDFAHAAAAASRQPSGHRQ
jgi:hypothetical protein